MKELKLNNRGITLISDEDFDKINRYKWNISPQGYVYREVYIGRVNEEKKYKKERILLHRVLMGLEKGNVMQVDHINGIRHDNRRENLRIVTKNQNSKNRRTNKGEKTSIYKGVYWRVNCFICTINSDKVTYDIAYSIDEEFLAREYDKAAIYLHGEYASLNFPDRDYTSEMVGYKIPSYKDRTTSEYRGVSWCNVRGKWKAEITIDGKYYLIGRFDLKTSAVHAFDQVCREFNLTDRINLPDEKFEIININKLKNRVKIKHSNYIGVRFSKSSFKYLAFVVVNNKEVSLGWFELELDAARCRDIYIINNLDVKKYKLNFDKSTYIKTEPDDE